MIDKQIICTEFAPDVFAHLRELDGIKNEDLKHSLDPTIKANADAIKKSGEGMGKSGSFFFFSHNKKLLIKTMTTNDFNAFMNLFREYFDHINVYRDSMLARIYGVYQVIMGDQNPVYLILMGNTKECLDSHVKCMFDLKGSRVKRVVKGKKKNTYALKDDNIVNMKKEENFIRFREKDIKHIRKKIAQDATLLSQYKLMDYSLLFVVQYNEKYVEKNEDQFEYQDGVLKEIVNAEACGRSDLQ